ncbi:M23 family metallopeptidase [Arthrobacter sp. B3I4]|uniref:M23 family metallopeptidase n=1 Tax=Arthrobacter sp. B3I4 TaxID=3042267 RepID=UPI0027D8C71D|nr:M23 family metallopeptidase [Arthrobacter sp. B3I4]
MSGTGAPVVTAGISAAGVAAQPTLGTAASVGRPAAGLSAAVGNAAFGSADVTAFSSAAFGAEGPLPGAGFTTDAHALVAYARSAVRTASKDGVPAELNVASAELKRPAEGFLMAPLESLHESSPFGLRTSPLSGSAGEFHWGQDYAADCGTRVYAADAGVVRAVGWHPWGGGNRVEIDHGNGLITTYNHLEAIAVKKGDSVRVGEVIARVGTTGSSTGCHLHFETILNGVHKDPHDWILIPIKQTDQLGTIEMTSYAPDAGLPSNASLGWAIPVSDDGRHEVTGGYQEVPIAEMPQTPFAYSPSPTPSVWDGLSPTRKQSDPTTGASQPPSYASGGTDSPRYSQPPSGTPTTSDPGTVPPTTSDPGTVPPTTSDPGTVPPPTSDPGTVPPPTSDPGTVPPPTSDPGPTSPSAPPPVVEPAPPPVVEPAPPPVLEPAPPPVLEPAPPPVVEPAPPPVVEPAPPPVVAPPPAPVVEPTVVPSVVAPTLAPPAPEPTAAPLPPETVLPSATPQPSGTAGP